MFVDDEPQVEMAVLAQRISDSLELISAEFKVTTLESTLCAMLIAGDEYGPKGVSLMQTALRRYVAEVKSEQKALKKQTR